MPIQGVVKFANHDRGFFFIKPDDGGADVFCHVREVQRAGYETLEMTQRVQYQLGMNSKNGRTMGVELKLLDPIISPPLQPTSFRSEERDDRAAHAQLAEMAFVKVPTRAEE
jgi:CspA family cold shock protein